MMMLMMMMMMMKIKKITTMMAINGKTRDVYLDLSISAVSVNVPHVACPYTISPIS